MIKGAITFTVVTNLDTGRIFVTPDWIDDEESFLHDDNLSDDLWTNDLKKILRYTYECYQITFGPNGLTEPASDAMVRAFQDLFDEDDTDILQLADLVAKGKITVVNPYYSDEPEEYEEDYYIPSSTAGDYGPGNPWDAPGMSIHDFI